MVEYSDYLMAVDWAVHWAYERVAKMGGLKVALKVFESVVEMASMMDYCLV